MMHDLMLITLKWIFKNLSRHREQQEDAVENAPEEVANPADLQGKPRSITLTLKLMPCVM